MSESAARIRELEDRAAALVEYGNSLPDGVTTEAFAEASLLRDEARKLRAAEGVAAIVCPKCGRMCWRVMTGGPACIEKRPA